MQHRKEGKRRGNKVSMDEGKARNKENWTRAMGGEERGRESVCR